MKFPKNPFALVALALLCACAGPGVEPPAQQESVPPREQARKEDIDEYKPIAEMAAIAEMMNRIEKEYVDPVPRGQLAFGCRTAMLKLAFTDFTLEAPTPDKPVSRQEDARQIAHTFNVVRQHLGDSMGSDKVLEACKHGMFEGLMQSSYIDPDEYKDMQVGHGGIGVEMRWDGGRPIVVSAIEDTPAARSGLQPEDAVVAIDGQPTEGLSLLEVMKRLRGKVGTPLRLRVERPGLDEPLELDLVRATIRLNTATWEMLAPAIAYLRVRQFQETTPAQVAAALAAIDAAGNGKTQGLVLDLRNNQGGLLTACVGVAAAFLPRDALVLRTEGRSDDSRMSLYARAEYYVRGVADPLAAAPLRMRKLRMVVLVNRVSAAGTEAIAAALQDHKRALIMGDGTYGLGLISTLFPTGDNTLLKIASARMYRPNGNALGPGGVLPERFMKETTPNAITSKEMKVGDDPLVRLAIQELGGAR